MSNLELTPDQLLTTTRAVRKRLDLSRPVERRVLEECLAVAQQAPTASNRQNWHFVVITHAEKRMALADLYRRSFEIYRQMPRPGFGDPVRAAIQERVVSSSTYLAEHLHEVPVLVLPCIVGRTDGQPVAAQSAQWGTIGPAIWSFMLAARARGLGTVWTSLHLRFEEEAAAVAGIPYSEVMQAALIPVAYTKGTEFQPAPRDPLSTMVHWDAW